MSSRRNEKDERILEERVARIEKTIGTRQGDVAVHNIHFLVEQLRGTMDEVSRLTQLEYILTSYLKEKGRTDEFKAWFKEKNDNANKKPDGATVSKLPPEPIVEPKPTPQTEVPPPTPGA